MNLHCRKKKEKTNRVNGVNPLKGGAVVPNVHDLICDVSEITILDRRKVNVVYCCVSVTYGKQIIQ